MDQTSLQNRFLLSSWWRLSLTIRSTHHTPNGHFIKFFFLTFDSPFWIVSLYQSSVSSCIPPCIINAIPFHRIFHPSWIEKKEKKENFFSCPIFLYGILFKSILIDRHHYVLYQYKYSYELQSSDKKKRSPFKWW